MRLVSISGVVSKEPIILVEQSPNDMQEVYFKILSDGIEFTIYCYGELSINCLKNISLNDFCNIKGEPLSYNNFEINAEIITKEEN